ncbi:hypothetical protein ACFX19_042649 [Malus domestica]
MWRLVDEMIEKGYPITAQAFNILLRTCGEAGLAKKLGKLDQFHRLLDEMGRSGFTPDFHTYNILLHVLGKGDKPLAAPNLLNHMKEEGFGPSVLHFTTLIDGLSRAGNMDAC